MVLKRLGLFLINILFPPLTVLILCGPETDLIINCLLFIAGVLPSHIHTFYISNTYFNRKRKVRKGVYPGKWRWGIYSQKVQNGGASNREMARLKRKMAEGKKTDTDYDEEEWNRGRSNSMRRASRYNNGYGPEVQEVPSRSGTRNSEFQPDVQQVSSRSGTRNSGYQPDTPQVLSRSSTRHSGYQPDMERVSSQNRPRNSGYENQDMLRRTSTRRTRGS